MNPQLKAHRHPGLWSIPQPIVSAQTESNAQSTENFFNELQHAVQHYPQDKWITLIGTPPLHADINSRQMQQWIHANGLNPHRIRWIKVKDAQSRIWATEQALLLDNSALIVAWLGQCSSREQQRLLLATKHTAAKTFLYHQAEFSSPLH